MSEPINMNAVYKTGHSIRLGKWALDPCWRCGRQPETNEVVQFDILAQVVTCAVCHHKDLRKLAQALDRAAERITDQFDGTGAPK